MLALRTMASLATLVLVGALAIVMSISPASAAACDAAWSSTAAYSGGAQVSYGGRNYTAKWWSQGERPDLNAGDGGDQEWRDNGACDGGSTNPPPAPQPSCNYPNWVAGTWYPIGSIVRYTDGNHYIAVHENPGYDPVISHWFWDPYACGPTTPPTTPPPGPGGFVVSEAQFNQMFPSRNPFYTYSGLTTAMGAFPAFAKTGSDTVRRQEAAAFLANVGHETGGLVHIVEQNQANYPHYCDQSQPYGCPAGQAAYYGRGPIQLSWNFNYNAAGNALGLPLLTNPWLVQNDAAVAWKTALWYWMTQNGPGTMTAHDAMVNQRGFGETIRSINGSLECNGGNPAQVQSRINSYTRFVQILGTTTGGNLGC